MRQELIEGLRFSKIAVRVCGLLVALGLPQLLIAPAYSKESAQLHAGRTPIDVVFSEPVSPGLRSLMLDWIGNAAHAVTTYHERFPVTRLKIRVKLVDGRGPSNGTTWNGLLITVSVGRASTAADFADDWLMTHEMLHLVFPSVPEKHHWIEEGISTYVEPIARARAGQKSAESVWLEFASDMPQGLPESGDRGLDFTPAWGRVYWGGALFCLLADVEIRKRTHNLFGLEHALRAIVAVGGTIESEWKLERVIEIGDRATGVPVLRELYDRMKATPVPVDLDALWRELGVIRQGGKVTFDDTAPHAAVRKAIISTAATGTDRRKK
jgi:hypothetical protein